MENATKALQMAFAVFAFIIALTLFFMVSNQAKVVSDFVLYVTDNTNFLETKEAEDALKEGRKVGMETIIPTLYRYAKENYKVKIYANSYNDNYNSVKDEWKPQEYWKPGIPSGGQMKLIQVFDTEIEVFIKQITSTNKNLYINSGKITDAEYKAYDMYRNEAMWSGNEKDTRNRIDAFLKGGPIIVNQTYSYNAPSGNGFIKDYKDKKFLEVYREVKTANTLENEDGSTIDIIEKTNIRTEDTKMVIEYYLCED